jgi:glycosyltransferase involved in cell wall biosynthesis
MCTYNGAKYIAAQLASIAAQTRLPDELILCDDGSTDATLQIA